MTDDREAVEVTQADAAWLAYRPAPCETPQGALRDAFYAGFRGGEEAARHRIVHSHTEGRCEVSADHPLAKALRPSAETIARIERDEQANAAGFAALRNTPIGSSAPPEGEGLVELVQAMNDIADDHSTYRAHWKANRCREAAATIQSLQSMLAEARGALEDVVNPLSYLRRCAEAEGAQLSGAAYSLANDLNVVKGIARDALRKLDGERG